MYGMSNMLDPTNKYKDFCQAVFVLIFKVTFLNFKKKVTNGSKRRN